MADRKRPDDRDVYRPKTNPFGQALGQALEDHPSRPPSRPPGVPVLSWDADVTGRYEGDDLQQARAARPTAIRLERLEQKHDSLSEAVADLRESVAMVSGKLEVLPQLVTAVKEASDRAIQREQVTFTASVEVDKAKQLGAVRLGEARAEQLTKLLAIVASIVAIVLALVEARRC